MHSPSLEPTSFAASFDAVEDMQLLDLVFNIEMTKDSMPQDGFSLCSSPAVQEEVDEVVVTQWSSEFALTLLALALASLFGAAWATKTLLQTLSSALELGN